MCAQVSEEEASPRCGREPPGTAGTAGAGQARGAGFSAWKDRKPALLLEQLTEPGAPPGHGRSCASGELASPLFQREQYLHTQEPNTWQPICAG